MGFLDEHGGVWVPGAWTLTGEPPPVDGMRTDEQEGTFTDGTGDMGEGGIDGDDDIDVLGDEGGGIVDVADEGVEGAEGGVGGEVIEVDGTGTYLEGEEFYVRDFCESEEVGERSGAVGVIVVVGVARPADANTE